MKKLFLALAVTATFVACKSKTESSLDTNKDLILLSDSSNLNNSYLTDTGYVNNGVIPGNTTSAAPSRATSSPAPARRSTSANRTNNNSNSNNTGVSNAPSTGTGQQSAPERRGISKAAKGAIIGGVGGAAAGAIIGKNAKGAVIGGAVGAAGGYIIGRGKDRRDGRVNN